ncbi:MAG: hypothetical protein M3N98_15900 [Actinomycetota bacterium]|nr:hypothetical protein [Actinomycetota bacterium]
MTRTGGLRDRVRLPAAPSRVSVSRSKSSRAGSGHKRASPGSGGQNMVDAILALQRDAGNAAVSAAITGVKAGEGGADQLSPHLRETVAFHQAQDAAEKAKGEKGMAETVDTLAQAIAEGNETMALALLRGSLSHTSDMRARYLAAKGRDLRADVLAHFSLKSPNLVRILAFLHSGDDTDPYAQMGLALIPWGTQDTQVLKLLEERSLDARKMLRADYREAFRGVPPGDGILDAHLVGDQSGWRVQKALALLDHDLTKAEHVHFNTTAISGAHQSEAVAILQSEWDKGPGVFRQLVNDWTERVQGVGWATTDIYKAMEDELTGEDRDNARAIFRAYRSWLGDKEKDPGQAKIDAAREQLEGLRSAAVFTDHAAVIKATARLRLAWEEVIAKDPNRRSEWEKEQLHLGADVPGELRSLRKWDRGDSMEASINLNREQTPADKIWLASERHDDKGMLAEVTKGWLAGDAAQKSLSRDCKKGDPPRPPLDLFAQAMRAGADETWKAAVLFNMGVSHQERGANRLALDFQGRPSSTAASDLQDAYDFLKLMKAEERASVVSAFVMAKKELWGDTWQERFGDFVDRYYETSVLKVDMKKMVLGVTSPEGYLKLAEEREAASHTGTFDAVGMSLVAFYDFVTAEETVQAADDSMRRLKRFVRETNASQADLQAMLDREGTTDINKLAALGYEQFKARLDVVRDVKGSAAEVVGMIVDFAGRSALVALFGPVGFAGLAAALGAYAGGMLVREGILGSEYQLASTANLSTLAAEVATFGFDELKIENVIVDLLTIEPKTIGGIVNLSLFEQKAIKGVQDGIKQAGSKFFEKAVQNSIEGKDFPTIEQIAFRALHAIDMGGVKGASSQYAKQLTVYTDKVDRFRTQVISIMLNGPPPKAALAMALTKEMTDLAGSGALFSMSYPEIAARFGQVAIQSAVSAIPVAMALGYHAENTAVRSRGLLKANPELVSGLAAGDEKITKAHAAYSRELKASGLEPMEFGKWVNLHVRQPGTLRYENDKKVIVEIDMKKWLSDQAKVLDAVLVPKDAVDKVGDGRG